MRISLKIKKNLQLILFFIIVFFIGCSFSHGSDNMREITSEKLLHDLLRHDIVMIRGKQINTIEYCPDNTCESFGSSATNDFEKLADFTYLYLYFVSDYNALSDFKTKTSHEHIVNLLKKYTDALSKEKKETQKAKDALRNLAKEYSIIVKFIRYDENKKNEVNIDLEKQLDQLSR